jgi:hypothetical protein
MNSRRLMAGQIDLESVQRAILGVYRDHAVIRYSITSSARFRNDSEIIRPMVFAVLLFTTSSNFVGACTGRSAGFSPRRMWST